MPDAIGDPAIANHGTICKVAIAARRAYVRNPIPGVSDRFACIAYLDPHLPCVEIPVGPARTFDCVTSVYRLLSCGPNCSSDMPYCERR